MGAMGYAFNLFSRVVPYDELTHSFTTFSVSLAFYFLFYGGTVPRQRVVAMVPLYLPWVLRWARSGRFSNGSSAITTAWPTQSVISSWTASVRLLRLW